MRAFDTRAWLGGALAIAALGAASAVAAPQPAGLASTGSTQVIQRLTDCRKLADNVARLACFDEAAASLDQAQAKGDIVVVDREQARAVRRQAFGFALPSLAIFERGEKPETIDAVTLPVKSVSRGADGKWVIRFDGQAWRQIDTGEFSREPKPGMAATIRSGTFGSYIMSVGGHAGVRVKRTD